MPLERRANLDDPDAVYNLIVEAHRGLDEAASAALSARLVLLLANHIGDVGVIREAVETARAADNSPAR